MDRRSYLGAMGVAGSAGLAGCLGDVLSSGDSDTALGPPEQTRGDPSHPIHGEPFPSVSATDPLSDETVSLEDFEGERAYMITFIFTSCTQDCATLVRLLSEVQADAADRGYEDEIAFLAMTFDPETDGPEELREYGETNGADVDADNWYFLRPESNEEAMTLINDEIGVPVDLETAEQNHEDHDHGEDGDHDHGDENTAGHHDGDDHSHDGDGDHSHDNGTDDEQESGEDDTGRTEGVHYYSVFLVNDKGIVERSYPRVTDNREETRPISIIEDVRTVVE